MVKNIKMRSRSRDRNSRSNRRDRSRTPRRDEKKDPKKENIRNDSKGKDEKKDVVNGEPAIPIQVAARSPHRSPRRRRSPSPRVRRSSSPRSKSRRHSASPSPSRRAGESMADRPLLQVNRENVQPQQVPNQKPEKDPSPVMIRIRIQNQVLVPHLHQRKKTILKFGGRKIL
ncbi:hypothetical protein Avbf_01546 [Armadillidium vulgare]|nr:hypothetical protein Avbf_01546 [Armadillidium vulgare]